MHELMRIKEMVCEEAIKLTERGVNSRDLEPLYYMIEIMKGVLKIAVLEEELEGGYSQRRGGSSRDGGGYSQDGGYSGERYSRNYSMEGGGYSSRRGYSGDGGSYDSGDSYARRGEHYVRGHYSRDDGMEHMKRELDRVAEEAQDPKVKEAIRRIAKQMEG